MCKETLTGHPCPGCGQRIQFYEYHITHCVLAQARKLREREEALALTKGAAS